MRACVTWSWSEGLKGLDDRFLWCGKQSLCLVVNEPVGHVSPHRPFAPAELLTAHRELLVLEELSPAGSHSHRGCGEEKHQRACRTQRANVTDTILLFSLGQLLSAHLKQAPGRKPCLKPVVASWGENVMWNQNTQNTSATTTNVGNQSTKVSNHGCSLKSAVISWYSYPSYSYIYS